MSLYLKYRPKDFNEIIGNENNKIILNGFLKQEEIPRTYLFYGAKGHGKTTFARIMAEKLNCNNNIFEINGSNNTGVDTSRQIEEYSQFRPLDGSNKAFILDEYHMATKNAQNSLLKVLEDTPKGVYFFICTTDPQKLLSTIISRCKKIEVENITVRNIYPYLINISIKENNEISKSVARKISETCKGDIREALNILEKVMQFKDEEIQLKIANEGIIESKQVIDLCRKLNQNSTWNEIKEILKKLQNDDPEKIRRIIISYFSKVLLDRGDRRSALIIDILRNPCYNFEILVCDIYGLYYEGK